MNARPEFTGMGAFEGFSNGVLLQQRAVRLAKLALDGLDDEAFEHVLIEAMRADAGFIATDMRLLVLAASLDGTLDTTARIEMSAGPYAGTTWTLHSATRDPAGIGWECRGRQVT